MNTHEKALKETTKKLSREDIERLAHGLIGKFKSALASSPDLGKSLAEGFVKGRGIPYSEGKHLASFPIRDGGGSRSYTISLGISHNNVNDYYPWDNVQKLRVTETVGNEYHDLSVCSVRDLLKGKPHPTVYAPKIKYSSKADGDIEDTILAVKKAGEMLGRLFSQK